MCSVSHRTLVSSCKRDLLNLLGVDHWSAAAASWEADTGRTSEIIGDMAYARLAFETGVYSSGTFVECKTVYS
jgi:hypothetical protein